ncbi:DUF397 domain-containing protein [Nonomuraea sp. NPDC046570]
MEIATLPGQVLVRDGKHPDGPVLSFTPSEWTTFLYSAKIGHFDLE